MKEKFRTFETDRLILRKFEIGDAQQMYNNYCSNDNVTQFLSWNTHKSVDDTKEYVKNFVLPRYESENPFIWAVVYKENNEVIGSFDICKLDVAHKRAEFGWVLSENYWGKRIMPEAAKLVLDYMFSLDLVRIQAYHYIGNSKSGKAMQKLGMIHEGTLHKWSYNNKGELVDCEMYALLK